MKFGVREICEVVLKAKATQKVGLLSLWKMLLFLQKVS